MCAQKISNCTSRYVTLFYEATDLVEVNFSVSAVTERFSRFFPNKYISQLISAIERDFWVKETFQLEFAVLSGFEVTNTLIFKIICSITNLDYSELINLTQNSNIRR